MFVFLAGLLLGPKLGTLSMVIYVVMGAIGIPVFSNYTGGIFVLATFRGGFIIGFIFSALFIGLMKSVIFLNKNYLYIFLVLVVGNMIIYIFVASYMAYLADTSLFSNLALFIPYFIGDLLKIIVVIYVYKRLRYEIIYERTWIWKWKGYFEVQNNLTSKKNKSKIKSNLQKEEWIMVFEKLKKIIIDELSVDASKVTLEAHINDDLGADSLDAVELVMAIEDEFEIKVNDDVAQAFTTVQEIVDFIESKV